VKNRKRADIIFRIEYLFYLDKENLKKRGKFKSYFFYKSLKTNLCFLDDIFNLILPQ
jgi:hypothetical protein